MRPDRDVDIRFYVGRVGVGMAPYEVHWPIADDDGSATVDALAAFVAGLLEERIVMVYRRDPLRGGRQFVELRELIVEDVRDGEWVASWRGTHDRAIPQ